jgi:cephalosporin hydroxylase
VDEVDDVTRAFARQWWDASLETFFPNRFMGLLCLQHPFDAWITQELIFETRPEVVIECGSLGGGSAVMWASYLEAYADAPRVVAIDIEDRMHQARELPIWDRCITFLHGSSTDPDIVAQAAALAEGRRTMVILDSLHTEPHVTAELAAYAGLVSPGCYLIVQDGFVNGHPCEDDWGPGPLEALEAFLAADDRFEVDRSRERMMFTLNPSGFLRRRVD